MEKIRISGTQNSPEVEFDFDTNTYSLKGMSYLEDINGFYSPITEKFEGHLKSLTNDRVSFTFEMTYFNSSSARVVLSFLDTLEATAERGNDVTIFWRYPEDDDTMEEHGEEMGEDLEHARFEMVAFPD